MKTVPPHELEPPAELGSSPESGVINDARRHRRRERIAVSLLLLAAIGAVLFLVGAGDGAQIPRPHSSRPHWMTGAPLSKPTHLRLLASENAGPASIVNVDDGTVRAVHGLGVPAKRRLWSPTMWPLFRVSGGALGVVSRGSCGRCTGTETHFLIRPNGSVHRISTLRLAPDQSSAAPIRGALSASWVITHPRGGPCTLRAEPGSRPAVRIPCGQPAADTTVGAVTAAGVIVSTPSRAFLIDPSTGHIRARSSLDGQLDVIDRTWALACCRSAVVAPVGEPRTTPLTLINLTTGAQRYLRWPSTLVYGYEAFPEPHSSNVAVEFLDPAYAGAQASDVWLLNIRTGTFRHVPGFPILEYIKFSGLAWTADHRLVIVAHGPRRTALGIWRPGSRRLEVGAIPPLSGYTGLVPFVS